jgi:energy-coupling factor transporter ATP-binding protein EcfA2
MKTEIPLPDFGERALIIGQTGSGKTNLAFQLLHKLPFAPFVIYDTKDENKFFHLPRSVMVTSESERDDAVKDDRYDFVILRPPAHITVDPVALDELLQSHYDNLQDVGAYIDEAYSFHHVSGNVGGRGLPSLLTRGRSRGQSLIVSTQRPSRISKFLYTEAQKFYVMFLAHADDRKTVGKFIPNYDIDGNPKRFGYWFLNQGDLSPKLFPPVALAKPPKQEYKAALDENSFNEIRLKSQPKPIKWI